MRFILALLLTLFASLAFAQAPTPICFNSYDPPSTAHCQQVDATNPFPISGTITASLGAYAPGGVYSTLAVTTTTGNVALPAGTSVVVYNTGSVAASVKLGIGSGTTATTTEDQVAPGCFSGFTVGSNTFLAAITATSTTNLVISGGSGLPSAGCAPNVSATITGSTSNASSAVATSSTNLPTVSYNYGFNGTTWDQLQVDGSKNLKIVGTVTANAGTNLNTSALATSANQATEISSLATIATNTGAAIPAGTAAIGTLLPFVETTASSGVLKASAGNLYTLSADAVTATTDLKLLLFNSATLPADGTVAPYKCLSFKGDGTQASLLLSWTADALAFTTGISAAVSSATACTTKTNVTATISGQVQ